MRLLLLALLASGSVLADDTPKARARALFKDGDAAFQQSHYDEAIQKYNEAFTLVPLPLLLFDLGQAYRMKGEREKAVDNYRKYLDVDPNGKGAAEAREHLEELTAQIRKDQEAKRAADEAKKRADEEHRRAVEEQRTTAAAQAEAESQKQRAAAEEQRRHQAELVAERRREEAARPLWKKPALWIGVGAAVVVVGIAVGVGVAYGTTEKDPMGSLRPINGN